MKRPRSDARSDEGPVRVLLFAASLGGNSLNKRLAALAGVVLERHGARVYPDMFSLAQAHKAFTETGELADRPLAERFEQSLRAFVDLVEAATHYPCMKKAWIEFLGEPGETVGRVDAA